jgi:imidazolonepropionase-like amidohydrolase
MRTVFFPDWLIDGSGDAARQGQVLGVSDGRIDFVGSAAELAPAADDTVVRAPGVTLLHGLINMHAHLTLASDNQPFVPYMDAHSDVALALRAAHNAAASLRAGVTTVRDCGSRRTTVLDLRTAIAQHLIEGPRIVSAGWPLTISGGHMRPFGGEVDGVEGVRQMVRRLVSAGADFIKVAGSGGGTPGSLTDYPSFLFDEHQAIVQAAHGLGRRVTVHCTATAAIAVAAEAGVDSLEHGYFAAPETSDAFDAAVADRLAERGISVTPTLQVFRDMAERLPPGPERDVWQRRRETLLDHAGRLRAAGVVLTGGSDAGWRLTRFDDYWRELEELVNCGHSPVEAIHAATGAASRAMARHDEFGLLRPGLRADLLLVDGDASRDVRRLAAVRGVYVDGRQVV